MNAYGLMTFLLLFNISISVVLSLGIYNNLSQPSPVSIEGGEYIDGGYEDTVSLNVSELSNENKADLLSKFGGNILIALLGGILLGGALSYVTQVPGDSAFAYSMFITFYWSMAKNTIEILYTLAGNAGVGLLYVVVIFVVILGISFLSFMIQLVRGPWQSMV